MRNYIFIAAFGLISIGMICVSACTAISRRPTAAELQQQVNDTERAFAKTMADRDFTAFQSFLSAEAIFFSGPKPLHGKQEIANRWKRLYEPSQAPFSWEPETVEVLKSGKLALSTGPVHDLKGKLVGTFTSIWRQDAPNTWHIVFDQGNDVCDCQKP